MTVVLSRLSSGTWSANAGAASATIACASPASDASRRSMSDTQADGTARSPGKHAPRNVRMPAVFATASNSCVTLLFPMPASPRMTSVAPWPSAARLSAAPSRVMTASRPTNNELVVMRLARSGQNMHVTLPPLDETDPSYAVLGLGPSFGSSLDWGMDGERDDVWSLPLIQYLPMVRLSQLSEIGRKSALTHPCQINDDTPWTVPTRSLSEARLGLVTTAGLHSRGDRPFVNADTTYRVLRPTRGQQTWSSRTSVSGSTALESSATSTWCCRSIGCASWSIRARSAAWARTSTPSWAPNARLT